MLGLLDALDVATEALRDFEADACVCEAPPGGHRFACPASQHAAALARIRELTEGENDGT